AYFLAGKPSQGLEPWGSFEGWSDTVRNAIVWAGLPDPGLTRVGLTSSDPKRAALVVLFEALAKPPSGAKAPPGGWLVSEIITEANIVSPGGLALKEAILTLCPSRDSKLSPIALGTKLARHRERVVGSYKLVAVSESNKGWRWAVQPHGLATAAPATTE